MHSVRHPLTLIPLVSRTWLLHRSGKLHCGVEVGGMHILKTPVLAHRGFNREGARTPLHTSHASKQPEGDEAFEPASLPITNVIDGVQY